MQMKVLAFVALSLLVLTGCIRRANVQMDAQLREQAQEAFTAGQYERARALIAKADKCKVPWTELNRRTLDLRIAQAEGMQQGELHRLLLAWGDPHDEWTVEDKADAVVTMAEVMQGNYALDLLYDMDPSVWSAPLRSRYNLLFAKLLNGQPELYDNTVSKWVLGVYALYDAGQRTDAAWEAYRCAKTMRNAGAAVLSAKIFNELHRASEKEKACQMALTFAPEDSMVASEVALVRSAPLGTKSAR